MDAPPSASPVVPCLTAPVLLSANASGDGAQLVLPTMTVLPVQLRIPAALPIRSGGGSAEGYFAVLVGGANAADAGLKVAEMSVTATEVVASADQTEAVEVVLSVSVAGEISVEVIQLTTKLILGSFVVPSK